MYITNKGLTETARRQVKYAPRSFSICRVDYRVGACCVPG